MTQTRHGDCARGCLTYAQHAPGCTCTNECPDHTTHCEGCLPREAEIGNYCTHCAFKLRDAITDIPHLARGVTSPIIPNQTLGETSTRRATKVDQHSPSPSTDIEDECDRWLHAWALAVADERHERGPFRYRNDGIPETTASVDYARYLTTNLAHLCAAPYADDIYAEALQLRHHLTRAAGLDNADQRIPTPCPHCNQRTLIRPNGEDHVTCRNRKCGAAWSSDHLGILAREATA